MISQYKKPFTFTAIGENGTSYVVKDYDNTVVAIFYDDNAAALYIDWANSYFAGTLRV